MTRDDMLTALLGQAAAEGGDLVTLRAIVEEASEIGAERVLNRIGLGDDGAEKDIDELRELLAAWRAAKAAIAWVVRALFALLLIGLAVRFGFPEMLK
jgi:hypothetical protein